MGIGRRVLRYTDVPSLFAWRAVTGSFGNLQSGSFSFSWQGSLGVTSFRSKMGTESVLIDSFFDKQPDGELASPRERNVPRVHR
jgi:hypothetical protein